MFSQINDQTHIIQQSNKSQFQLQIISNFKIPFKKERHLHKNYFFQVAELEVVIPPQISDKLSTEDLSVREGGSAKFICSATGHPQPTITWQKMPNGPREKARIRVTNDKGKETHRKTVHGEVLDIGKNQCCQLLVKKM